MFVGRGAKKGARRRSLTHAPLNQLAVLPQIAAVERDRTKYRITDEELHGRRVFVLDAERKVASINACVVGRWGGKWRMLTRFWGGSQHATVPWGSEISLRLHSAEGALNPRVRSGARQSQLMIFAARRLFTDLTAHMCFSLHLNVSQTLSTTAGCVLWSFNRPLATDMRNSKGRGSARYAKLEEAIEEGNQGFIDGQRQRQMQLRETQDSQLDSLSSNVAILGSLSLSINDELEQQGVLVDSLQEEMTSTRRAMKNVQKKVKVLLASSDKTQLWVVVLLVLVILALIVIIISKVLVPIVAEILL